MATQPPVTAADFKARFARDFKFGKGTDQVMDSDIANAIADAQTLFNPALFSTADGKVAFLYATAHFVVSNVGAAGGLQAKTEGMGIENQADGIYTGKGVGGVSVNFLEPPPIVKNSPALYQFWRTDYGQRYLSMLAPKLVGTFGSVLGPRQPDVDVTPDIPFTDQ